MLSAKNKRLDQGLYSESLLWGWLAHILPTIKLSLPLIVGQVAMISIWTADIIMMGWIDANALAAGTLANRLFQPMYFIAIGLTLAVSPLTSQALGAGSRRKARRIMRQGIWIAVAYGAITIVPMWYGEPLLLMLGQDPELAIGADLFLKLLAPGIIPTYIYFVLRHYVSAHKMPMPPVVVTSIGVIINIILNAVFSYGYFGIPALGFAGIGLATSVTFTAMAIILALYIHMTPPFRFIKPFARMFRIDTKVMKQLLVVGLPIGVTLFAETGMFIVAGFYIGLYGKIAVAATGIANQIAAVTYMVPLAISQAATIRVGHEAGAKKAKPAMNAAIAGIAVTIGITLLLTVMLFIWTEFFIGLFLNPVDIDFTNVMAVAIPMVVVVALFQLADGLQCIFTAVLRGINDTRWPAVISIFSYWCVGVASGIFLAGQLDWGPIGVWWGLLLGLSAGSLFLFIRCLLQGRKIINSGKIILE